MKSDRVSKNETIDLKKYSIITIIIYVLIAMIFWIIAHEQLTYKESKNNIESIEPNAPIGEITKDLYVKQSFVSPIDYIDSISLNFATYGRINSGNISILLLDGDNNKILYDWQLDISKIDDNSFVNLELDEPLKGVLDKKIFIEVKSDTSISGNAVTLWYNNSETHNEMKLYVKDEEILGTLCFKVKGRDIVLFGKYYAQIIIFFGILFSLYLFIINKKQNKNEKFIGLNLLNSFVKYRFLLKQLVSRDFKTKYKRSVLGAFWSFLNPLLTMLVQYVVFSTIFKSDIKNFAVYLIIGIIMYSFFVESVGMGLSSIVGNASLITKVYVPKYIYPISRVLSSSINLVISMAPLFVVMLITRTPVSAAILLLPFSLFCILVFCLGMTLLLSSIMVFFRDTQFLWNVVSMLWMYATPIFYPESIIPSKFMTIYKMNPLYHFIRFTRSIILDGVSPEPKAYLLCLIAAFGTLAVGSLVFKKTQNKFVLYI